MFLGWHYGLIMSSNFQLSGPDFAMIRGAGETLVELTPLEFDWMYRAEFLTLKICFLLF